MKALVDEVVVVSGAASGIGRQIVLECLAEGARVAALDIDAQGLATLRTEAKLRPSALLTSVTDVTRADAVSEVAHTVKDHLGPVTGLVHSAYWTRPQRLTETLSSDWQKTLDVTLHGAFVLSQEFIPVMLVSGRGAIVPIASVHSLVGFPGYFAYQVAKAGLLGFVRSVAVDYGPTVRFNAVAPGAIATPALDDAPLAVRQQVEAQALLRRVGTAHEVARAVIFLLSAESSFMTGSTLVLDGGWTAI